MVDKSKLALHVIPTQQPIDTLNAPSSAQTTAKYTYGTKFCRAYMYCLLGTSIQFINGGHPITELAWVYKINGIAQTHFSLVWNDKLSLKAISQVQ